MIQMLDKVLENIKELKEQVTSIDKQLGILVSSTDSERGNLTQILNDIRSKQDKHEISLYGDVNRNVLGNCERLNRLEESEKVRERYFMAVALAAMIGFGKFMWDLVLKVYMWSRPGG